MKEITIPVDSDLKTTFLKRGTMRPHTDPPAKSDFYLVRKSELDFCTAYYDVLADRWDSSAVSGDFHWTECPEVSST